MTKENISYSPLIEIANSKIQFARIRDKDGLETSNKEQMLEIANRELPSDYRRLSPSYFDIDTVHSGGIVYDLSTQWKGNTYLALRDSDKSLVGFIVGNLYEQDNSIKGFGRLVAVEESMKGKGIGQSLVYLMTKGFLYEQVDEIKGSTSIFNTPLRSMTERYPILKKLGGRWMRYSITSEKAEKIVKQYEEKYPHMVNVWEALK